MAEKGGGKASCLMLLDEFGLVLKGMKDPKAPTAQVPQLLMELFSSAGRDVTKPYSASDAIVLPWHHLALYGSSTPSRFWESMSQGMALDGFLARLLIFESRHAAPMPKATITYDTPPGVIEAINGIYNIEVERTGGNLEGGIPVPRMVPKSPEAARLFDPWARHYHDLKNRYRESEDARSPIYGRVAEHAHKLALIHTISRCGNLVIYERVEEEDVVWAMSLMDHLAPHMIEMATNYIADDRFEADRKRTLAMIKKRATPEHPGMSLAELSNSTKWDTDRLKKVIKALEMGERILAIDHKPKRGTPTKLYCLAETRETRESGEDG